MGGQKSFKLPSTTPASVRKLVNLMAHELDSYEKTLQIIAGFHNEPCGSTLARRILTRPAFMAHDPDSFVFTYGIEAYKRIIERGNRER
jgi:hypothetical protein